MTTLMKTNPIIQNVTNIVQTVSTLMPRHSQNNSDSRNMTSQMLLAESVNYHSTTKITLLLILAFVAFIANVLVCLPIIVVPKIRTTINCFVLSLCMTQILTDCIVIPLYCFALTSIVYSYVVAFVVISYVTNLLALTFDRYFAIKFPLRYRGIMWRGRCIRVILACWVVSTLVQILPVFWYNSDHHKILHKVYLSAITIIFLLLPLCIVIFAYVSIFIEIVSSTQKEKRRRVIFKKKNEEDNRLNPGLLPFPRSQNSTECINAEEFLGDDRKASNFSVLSGVSVASNAPLVKMFNRRRSKRNLPQPDFRMEARSAIIFFVIIVMYGATWIPVLFMTVAGVLEKSDQIPKSMKTGAIYIMAGNTLLDPLIYGLCMKDIRKHLGLIVSSFCKSR